MQVKGFQLLEYQWCEGIFDLDACPPFSLSLRQPQWVKVHCTSVKFVKFSGDSEGSKEGTVLKINLDKNIIAMKNLQKHPFQPLVRQSHLQGQINHCSPKAKISR